MKRAVMAAAVLFLLISGMPAEVTDSGSNGFTVNIMLMVQGEPDQNYRKFLRVGDWWSSQHTFSGNARNLSMEEKVMGCWCEKPPGGMTRHMELVMFAPGSQLVFSGGIGPLQALGVSRSMTVKFSPSKSGTKIELTYAVGGYLAGGVDRFAAPVDSVLTEQLTRLKNYAEHGDPEFKQPAR